MQLLRTEYLFVLNNFFGLCCLETLRLTVLLSWVLTHPGLGTLDINLSQLSGVAVPARQAT
jgi:hypothetical protein